MVVLFFAALWELGDDSPPFSFGKSSQHTLKIYTKKSQLKSSLENGSWINGDGGTESEDGDFENEIQQLIFMGERLYAYPCTYSAISYSAISNETLNSEAEW